MKHVAIRSADSIPSDAIRAWVREAVALNAEQGNPTMRRG
jgi:hypothetical protein